MSKKTKTASSAQQDARPGSPPHLASFVKPAHWSNDPPPEPRPVELDEKLSPTRYGDWERKGIAWDF